MKLFICVVVWFFVHDACFGQTPIDELIRSFTNKTTANREKEMSRIDAVKQSVEVEKESLAKDRIRRFVPLGWPLIDPTVWTMWKLENHHAFFAMPPFVGKISDIEVIEDNGKEGQVLRILIDANGERLSLEYFESLPEGERGLEELQRKGAVVLPDSIRNMRLSILTD